MKTMVLIATLAVLSASPSFAQTAVVSASPLFTQTVQPAEHQTGIIDTVIEQADTVRCSVIRNDLPDEMPLSNCQEPASPR
jgi:hypothetical protein